MTRIAYIKHIVAIKYEGCCYNLGLPIIVTIFENRNIIATKQTMKQIALSYINGV